MAGIDWNAAYGVKPTTEAERRALDLASVRTGGYTRPNFAARDRARDYTPELAYPAREPKPSLRLINLTPHPVVLVDPADPERAVSILPEPVSARVAIARERDGEIYHAGITVPVYRTVVGEITSLPAPDGLACLIVSRVVYDAAKASPRGAADLYIPDDTIRDEQGRITGCRALAQP